MSLDTGTSFHFNPGSALGFDIRHSDNEEEDDTEEAQRREKELGDILTNTNAFDDLIEDDCETSIDVSDIEELRLHSLRKQRNEQTQVETTKKKKTETSTPMHEIPEWNIDYTPIDRPDNPALLPYHLQHPNGTHEISLTSPQVNFNVVQQESHADKHSYPSHVNVNQGQYRTHGGTAGGVKGATVRFQNDSDGLKERLNFGDGGGDRDINEDTAVGDEVDRHDPALNEYTELVLELKEQLLQQKEQYCQVIRTLKDELVLLKGEKERISFSLQQARELLLSKNEEVESAQLRAQEVSQDLHHEREKNKKLSEKLETCESMASALQVQVTELSSYKSYTKRIESQEALMRNMQQTHAEDLRKLHLELDGKVKEVELLQKRVNQLEKYQEQTLPTKMQGIDKLTLNLETVQKYCQQIVSSEAFRDVDVLRIHQLEDERIQTQQKKDIESLMATINSLNQKLHDVASQDSVPLPAHRTALKQLENERSNFEKRLQLTLEEFSETKKEKEFFQEENKKLQGTMKAMVMKHDLDIKSAIEKYHSIQRQETKLLQAELREATEREKDQLRECYEEKITILCQDMERLQTLLHETKELYLKVCEEKNLLESELQNKRQASVSSSLAQEKQQLEILYQERVKKELTRASEVWSAQKLKDIEEAVSKAKEEVLKSQEKKLKENAEHLETEVRELEQKLSAREQEILDLKAEAEEKVKSIQEYYTSLWVERQKEMHSRYLTKLDSIEQVQKKEFAAAMKEMQKVLVEEREDIVRKHKEILMNVKTEFDAQYNKLRALEESEKKNEERNKKMEIMCQELVSRLKTLEKQKEGESDLARHHAEGLKEQFQLREQTLTEKLNILNQQIEALCKDKELLVQRAVEFEERANEKQEPKKGKHVGSQTEIKLVPKQEVVELQNLCLELLIQMKEELDCIYSGSSRRAAKYLKLAVLDCQKQSNPRS